MQSVLTLLSMALLTRASIYPTDWIQLDTEDQDLDAKSFNPKTHPVFSYPAVTDQACIKVKH